MKKNKSVLLYKSTNPSTQPLLLTQIPHKQKAPVIDHYKSKREMNSSQTALIHKRLYPFVTSTSEAIEHIKRSKGKYNTLREYQESFISEITGKYHNESITKLNKTFFELRQQCRVKHRIDREYNADITHRSFIKSMEDKEAKIIKSINEVNKGMHKKMKRNRKYLFKGNGMVFDIDKVFPLLTFEKVVK